MNKQGKLICIKKCSNCGRNVEIRHKERLNRKNIFCSKKCENIFKKNNNEIKEGYFNCECPICKRKFHLKPYQLNKYSTHYCSKECHRLAKIEYMKGEKNPQYGLKGNKNVSWKSDRKITNYGYIKIRCLEHPFKDCDGFIFEHRLVAEKYLLNEENSIEINGKKYLKKEYTVHHKDMNKKNNNVSNLQVMTLSEHSKLHTELIKNSNCKKVNKFNLNGEYIETYDSIKEASEKNNIYSQNIIAVCKNKKGTAGGFIWKYKM